MDNLTPEQRRRNMSNIRSKNTKPELKLRSKLDELGFQYETYRQDLPGKPDIVFEKKKIVLFVDSEFWHGHPTKFIMPKSNQEYWRAKIATNKRRDRQVNKELKALGWIPLRIWCNDINKNLDKTIKRILTSINRSN
jgi:DNA mismatch endonuclease, patch repair protein